MHLESLILAWEKYRAADSTREKHYRGLKLGEVCFAVRRKVGRRGAHKGISFQPVLKQAGIPNGTAYRWIEKYAKSTNPDEWLAQAKAAYDVESQVRVERDRRAAREFQRGLRAELKRLRKLVGGAPPNDSQKKRERKKKDHQDRAYYSIGQLVEKKIPADRKQEKRSIIAARQLVSDETRLQFDVVAQYHKKFRRFLKTEPGITN